MKQRDVLESVQWATAEFGSLVSGGQIRKRDLDRAVRAGLVRSIGIVEVRDAYDSPTGRSAFGYVLTDAGEEALKTSTGPN